MTEALLVLGGYLLGSVPFGYWVVRLFHGEDIRDAGSGSIGATNVFRAYGARFGVSVAVLDVLKGFVPALVGSIVAGELWGILAGSAAMLGHWRPLFLRFAKGGKTVATAGGVFFGVAPLVGLAALGLWIVFFAPFRYASVASILAASSTPVIAALLGEPWPVVVFAAGAAAAVAVLHRANLKRLAAGTEHRVQLRRRAPA